MLEQIAVRVSKTSWRALGPHEGFNLARFILPATAYAVLNVYPAICLAAPCRSERPDGAKRTLVQTQFGRPHGADATHKTVRKVWDGVVLGYRWYGKWPRSSDG